MVEIFFSPKKYDYNTRTTLLWWINNINVFIVSNTSCIQIKTILSKVSKMVFNCFFSPIFFSSSCSFWDHQGITFSFAFLAWCLLKKWLLHFMISNGGLTTYDHVFKKSSWSFPQWFQSVNFLVFFRLG